jgi:hypothetical protein
VPIANPLTNAQISGQIADLYGQIGAVKSWRSASHNASGVTVTVYRDENETDGQLADKIAAIDAAIAKVSAKGLALPNAIKVYCSGKEVCGTVQMKNVAFQRGISGTRDPTIVLSPKVLNAQWAAALNGMCTQVYDHTPVGLATAIVVHEIGHLLHEIADEDSFWGAAVAFNSVNTALTPNVIFQEVSAYAATNAKELVAEVFLGRVYGRAFTPLIMNAYAALNGPSGGTL